MEKVMGYITKINQKNTIWEFILFFHANNPDAAQWYSEKWKV